MNALAIHAGPRALAHLRERGLRPHDVCVIPAAAGGPKGLVLGPLDRHLFGDWLPASNHTVHLLGASIGAWRMAPGASSVPRPPSRRWPRTTSPRNTSTRPASRPRRVM